MFVKYYFSPSTNGFYQDDIHSPSLIPGDAKEITLQRRDELLVQNADQGKVITADAANDPIAVDPDSLLTPAELALKAYSGLQKTRDDSLAALVYDFGDGRVMQVRPKDESNIRNAIERMTRLSISSREWHMADNTRHQVTAAELQTALESGQDQAATIWDDFFTALDGLS